MGTVDSPGSLARRLGIEMGIEIGEAAADRLDEFAKRLLVWNERVNLTAIEDPAGVAVKHFLDSLTALRVGEWPAGGCVIDVGTGGGLPGLVLKIARPDLALRLLDAQEKRVRAVREIVAELRLDGVEVVHGRAENLGRAGEGGWRESGDVGVIRAVGAFVVACEYVLPLVRVGGWAVLMRGPAGEAEADAGAGVLEELGGELAAVRRVLLPLEAGERVIVGIRKVKATPARYPRREGMPERRPLGQSGRKGR